MTEPEKDQVTSSTPQDVAADVAATASATTPARPRCCRRRGDRGQRGPASWMPSSSRPPLKRVAECDRGIRGAGRRKAEAADWQDKYVRLHAEWDTYRRRMTEQREAEKVRATEKLMESLIPVLDDFARTVDYAETNGETGLLGGRKGRAGQAVRYAGQGRPGRDQPRR